MFWVQESLGLLKKTCMDVQARVSAVAKVSKVVKWSRIFVHVFHNFRAIPIMNPLTRVHDNMNGYMQDFFSHLATNRQWRSYTGALAPPSASVALPSIF